MIKNDEHVRRTAQIWRAGGMIWLIFITMFFFIYDLYVAKLPIFLTTGIGGVAFAVTLILFAWSIKTLRLAKKLPDEKFIDAVKRHRIRKGFLIVLIIEIAGFNIAPFALLYFNHIEYIVPVSILICAIHFIPLARIFAMPYLLLVRKHPVCDNYPDNTISTGCITLWEFNCNCSYTKHKFYRIELDNDNIYIK